MTRNGIFICVAALAWAGPSVADHYIVTGTGDERNWDLACSRSPGPCLAVFSSGYSLVQLVTPGGYPIGSPSYPWSPGIAPHRTSIAYNPQADQYLLVTFDDASQPWLPYPHPRPPGLMAVVLNANAVPVGIPLRVLDGAVDGSNDAPYVRVAYNSLANEYLVTAQIAMGGGLADIFARRLSAAGAPLGNPVNVTNGPSDLNSHALAYAPVVSPETPTGRYLLVWDAPKIYMLNSNGAPLWMHYDNNGQPYSRNIPFEWGSKAGQEYHPDVAYGELELEDVGVAKVFLVVWSDYNNVDPHNPGAGWTGIWGGPVDAERLQYTAPPAQNSTFPISAICKHWAYPGTHLWLPRVAFNGGNRRFHVAWRETASDEACNDTRVYHIRANYVDYLYRYPPYANTVISQASGAHPGLEQPSHPAIAAVTGGALITWDDNRDAGAGQGRNLYGSGWGLPPVNDNCAIPTPIHVGESVTGTLTAATSDGDASCAAHAGARDAWYFFTSHCTGTLKVNTCGTNDLYGQDEGMNTVLSLHSDCPGTAGNTLACNEDWGKSVSSDPFACEFTDRGSRLDSAIAYPMAAEQSVWVRLSQHDPSDMPAEFRLNVSFEATPPANDQCPQATPLPGPGDVVQPFCSLGATTDGPDEPGQCTFYGYTHLESDLWYCYTPACAGRVTVTLCGGASYDTRLAVYPGCACGSLPEPIACNDDACGRQSEVSFLAQEGQSYLIRVGGYQGAQGDGILYVTCRSGTIDCNNNGIDDAIDISQGDSRDCNGDGIPDECQPDSDTDGVPDVCDVCLSTVPDSPVDSWGCPPDIPGDFDRDGDVDARDCDVFNSCGSGPAVPHPDPPECWEADFSGDGDVDQEDFGIFQRCYSGEGKPGDPTCVG